MPRTGKTTKLKYDLKDLRLSVGWNVIYEIWELIKQAVNFYKLAYWSYHEGFQDTLLLFIQYSVYKFEISFGVAEFLSVLWHIKGACPVLDVDHLGCQGTLT